MKWSNSTKIILLLGLTISLAVAFTDRVRLVQMLETASALEEETSRLEVHRMALMEILNGVELTPPFLAGDEVNARGVELVFDGPHDAVLYLLSSDCPYSSSNYPLLNEMHQMGVPVVGLAADSSRAAVERHRAEWDLSFPVLFNPEGGAMAMVPRLGTPTLIVLERGQVVLLEFGTLGPEAQQELVRITTGWTTSLPGESTEN